jgi:outer membrane protein assembly factor BamB
VIVASGDGDYRADVRAFDLAGGRVRWTTPVPASFEADLVPGVDVDTMTPGGSDGAVGVEDHLGTVSLLDLATGALRWRTDTGAPALGGRVVITEDAVVVRNEGRQLVILDRIRGRVEVRRTDPHGLPEGIVGAGDRVFVGWRWTEPGRIDALEIEIPHLGP